MGLQGDVGEARESTMRVVLIFLTIFGAGCSTAPLAGFLDRFYPGGVRNRDFNNPAENREGNGIGIGPPRPIDPLVETPPAAPPDRPARPAPSGNNDVVPPPTIGRSADNIDQTTSLRARPKR